MTDAERQAAIDGWENAKIERFNLAVLGATGVGKSTLVNAVFGSEVVETGIGRPVTKGVQFRSSETFGLYDFEGAESFQELGGFVKNFRMIYKERVEEDPKTSIHVIWYCIKASDRRFDDNQETVISLFREMKLPVILVVTQTPWHPERGMEPTAREFIAHLESRGLDVAATVAVSALDDEFVGTKAFGLQALLDASIEAAPEGVRQALAAAQHIDVRTKRREAIKVVAATSAAAAAIGATPVPVADAPALVAVQLGMMHLIARIYDVGLSRQAVIAALTRSLMVTGGRTLAGQLAKLVPGAGMLINASVAGGLTGVLGGAWIQMCEKDWLGELSILELAEHGVLGDVLRELLKKEGLPKADAIQGAGRIH